jgi:hypothetical protein
MFSYWYRPANNPSPRRHPSARFMRISHAGAGIHAQEHMYVDW